MRIVFLLLLSFLISINLSFAQDPSDALRYSFLTQDGGTARVQALGGAGGSLGGEFSNLFMNPAGLGFFKSGDFVITPSMLFNSNSSRYLGSAGSANGNRMSLGATGALFVTNYEKRKLRSTTLGFGINRSANFNNTISYQGKNSSSSYSEKYLEELVDNHVTNVNDAATLFPFGSSMAFNTYLVNPTLDANNQIDGYYTLADPALGLGQSLSKTATGGITDVALGVGANYSDKIFIGGTITVPILQYHRKSSYLEDDLSGNAHNNFNFFQADEDLKTTGVGINAKLGIIYRPVTDFQVGLSFYTPTFFQLTDLYNMTITTDPEGFEGKGVQFQSSADLNDGNYLRSTYNLSTPLRLIASGTYFISTGIEAKDQKGFITADVEYVNYRSNNFLDANNDQDYKTYYKQLNSAMDDIFSPAVNARIGGELKLNTFMVRLGGAYYGNPYSNENTSLYKVSGGLGYRSGGFYIDLAYTYGMHKTIEYPYLLQDAKTSPAMLSNNGNNVALTFGFKLN